MDEVGGLGDFTGAHHVTNASQVGKTENGGMSGDLSSGKLLSSVKALFQKLVANAISVKKGKTTSMLGSVVGHGAPSLNFSKVIIKDLGNALFKRARWVKK